MPRPHSRSRLRETTTAYIAARSPHPAGPPRARLFRNGRSQAVRLPKEFRMSGTEVSIRRDGEAVILEPIPLREWPPGYFDSWKAGSRLERPTQPPMPSPKRLDGGG
jgi:virulence-associated protein VagC